MAHSACFAQFVPASHKLTAACYSCQATAAQHHHQGPAGPCPAPVARSKVGGLRWQPAQARRTRARVDAGVVRTATDRALPTLKEGIASFYDASSGVWEDMWGEHMHHGYYPDGQAGGVNHQEAQVDMIDRVLEWAGVAAAGDRPRRVLDVGCGIGGSSRHMARKYGAQVTGITLSPVQAQRATALALAQGLEDKASFEVADALDQPFPSNHFDLVWSLESGEHMPNKAKFVGELARVAAPGGRIIIVTWCHRDLKPEEKSLSPREHEVLDKICKAYYLPAWCSAADYMKFAEEAGLQDMKRADWSEYITPFWPAVVASALTWRGMLGLLKAGWSTIRGALVMTQMIQGYRMGLIKFALITATKPARE